MSGTTGLGNLVLSLYSPVSSGGDAAGLLATIYGGGSAAASNADPAAALKTAETNSTKNIAIEAAQPGVARDIATFKSAVASATSASALLQNPTVLKVLLTANGLGDQVQYPALARKALLSNTSSSSALANTLSNTAWASTASLYDFANKGLSVLQNSKVIDTIANGYAEVLWRNSLDSTTPGLSEALSFRDSASSITSADQILGNANFRTVVTTALNIPQQIALQDIGAQEKAITSKLDISRLKDPAFVTTLTTQYLINAAANATSSGSSTSTLDQLTVSAGGLVV